MRRRLSNRQPYYRDNRLVVVLVLALIFICVPSAGGAGYAIIKQISSDDIRLLLGAGYFLLAFVVITGGFSLVLAGYSRLRRVEESEDDKREIELLKLAMGGQRNWILQPPQQAQIEQPVMQYEDVDFE